MEKIKSNIDSILGGSFPNDLLADREGKEENISERTGKAYNYLIEHKDELSFKEFEEVFFHLLFKSYRYERNLESPEMQLLSFEETNDCKIKYISLICKLMERQFKEYASFSSRELSKTKAGLLPEFTYHFGMPFWQEIKSIAEEALQFVSNGEIANRERFIAETAIQCRQHRNRYVNLAPKQKFDYEPYEKYLDLQLKGEFSISDCFFSDKPTTELPTIKQYYFSDHSKIHEMYNKNDDDVYAKMKQAYYDKIFNHAFACPAMINFFDSDENWLEIGAELHKNNQKLEKSQEDKKQIINEFAHTYSNMKATTLHEIADALLTAEGEEFRYYGGLVMVEYSIKKNLTKEIQMLKLRFEDNVQELLKEIRSTVFLSDSENTIQIQDIVSDAWRRCFITLLYDESSKGKDWRNLFFGTENHEEAKKSIKDDFEEYVLVKSNRYSTAEWLQKSGVINFQFSVSGLWNEIYFNKDDYASLLLTDWISEIFTNVIRYADKNQPVIIKFSSFGELLHIQLNNTKKPHFRLHNTQIGLHSMNAYLKKLNQNVGFNGQSMEITNSENNYELNMFLKHKIFTERI